MGAVTPGETLGYTTFHVGSNKTKQQAGLPRRSGPSPGAAEPARVSASDRSTCAPRGGVARAEAWRLRHAARGLAWALWRRATPGIAALVFAPALRPPAGPRGGTPAGVGTSAHARLTRL